MDECCQDPTQPTAMIVSPVQGLDGGGGEVVESDLREKEREEHERGRAHTRDRHTHQTPHITSTHDCSSPSQRQSKSDSKEPRATHCFFHV
eukprot:1602132-Rhodomonas_salina.2